MTYDESLSLRNCRMGMILSLVLHSTAPSKYKFLQATIGVEFWRQGCTQKIFQTLNYLGLSLSKGSSRGRVDKLILSHDEKVTKAKANIEVYAYPTFFRIFIHLAKSHAVT